MLKKLDWDSTFFNYPVYKLSLNNEDTFLESIELLLKTDFKLAYLFTRNKILDCTHSNSSILLNLVDQKVTYSKSNIPIVNKSLNIVNNPKYQNQISNLCIQSGEYSRFKIDKNFQNNEFTKLYEIWGANAINNISKTILAEFDEINNIIGIAIVSVHESTLNIEIIAVDKVSRNMGIGTALINQIYNFCNKNQCVKIDVVTQLDNHTACSFYEKNGFHLNNLDYIYHIWKK